LFLRYHQATGIKQAPSVLIDIITIALCAVICNDTWEEIEEFVQAKHEWFATFLDLPHGVPSPATFERVFASIDPVEFREAFLQWVEAVKGCIITIDAMGCQKAIAGKIIDNKADYVVGVKGNQGNLHADVELFFQDCLASDFTDVPYDYCEMVDGDHGRIETRRYRATSDIEWLSDKPQ
jgi:predicted transposase YbfD/YdcC